MKKSKLLPLVLALTLVLLTAFPLSAFGATIVVQYPPEYDVGGLTFKVYKIYDVTTDGSGNYAYILDGNFAGFIDYPTYGVGQSLFEYLDSGASYLTENSPEMTAIAANLWHYVEATSMVPTATATGVPHNQEVTFVGLDPGYYLVYSLGTVENDVTVVAACSLVTADDFNEVTVLPKVDVPTIQNLKIYNPDSVVPNSGLMAISSGTPDPAWYEWRDWTDVNIGDTVEFRVLTKVPANTPLYANGYIFTVHGQMDPGLTFIPSSVEVRVGAANGVGGVLINPSNYTVDPVTPTAGGAFQIRFDPMAFVDTAIFPTGAEIVINYTADLNKDAAIGAPGNAHTIFLEYSTNSADVRPYDERETGTSVTLECKVYTFEVEIFKFHGSDNALAKAKFTLHDGGAAIALKEVSLATNTLTPTTSPNVYRLAMPGETGTVTEVETPISGGVIIQGLGSGDFSLEETRAPDGFNKLTSPIPVVIVHTNGAGVFTVNGSSNHTVKVENKSGFKLPETGGAGTTIFYAVSAVLTAFLVVFFVSHRRKKLLKG